MQMDIEYFILFFLLASLPLYSGENFSHTELIAQKNSLSQVALFPSCHLYTHTHTHIQGPWTL